jgi:hypothetical protein
MIASAIRKKKRKTNKDSFVLRWILDSDNFTVVLPLPSSNGEVYDFEVDWGDGTREQITSASASHTYAKAGTYYTRMTGRYDGFYIYHSPSISAKAYIFDGTTKDYLDAIMQWGTNKWYTIRFPGSKLAEITRSGAAPDFSGVTNMFGLFALCKLRNDPAPNLFKNVPLVTDFHAIYSRCDIRGIPKRGFLANCQSAYDIASFFAHNKIKEIPEDIFVGCESAVITRNMFRNNLIEVLTPNIFDPLVNSTEMAYCLGENLYTSVPAGLFANNTKCYWFEEVFVGAPIDTIEGDIFGANTTDINAHMMFSGCPVGAIPADFMSQCTGTPRTSSMFSGSPINGVVPELWNMFPAATNTAGCFSNTTNITNAADIPASWK